MSSIKKCIETRIEKIYVPFLSAHWKNLILANYCVEPKLLAPFVPTGTTLDEFEGKVFVSLVAFMFDKMNVVGVPAFFYRRFEEVNLRFYVTPNSNPEKRAVTFIKEIVPKRLITFVANTFFQEKYVRCPMCYRQESQKHSYQWTNAGVNKISCEIDSTLTLPEPGSVSEFITEHYWGYSKGPSQTTEYEVKHPQWKCCETSRYQIDVDFGKNYGEQFGFLGEQDPYNVLFAEGSPVTVSFPRRL